MYFKALYKYCWLIIFEKCVVTPNFFWISITLVEICFSRTFSKPRKYTFELVATVLTQKTAFPFYLLKWSSHLTISFISILAGRIRYVRLNFNLSTVPGSQSGRKSRRPGNKGPWRVRGFFRDLGLHRRKNKRACAKFFGFTSSWHALLN